MEAAAFHGRCFWGKWLCVIYFGCKQRLKDCFPTCIIRFFMTAIFYLCLTRLCWSSFRQQWLATILMVNERKRLAGWLALILIMAGFALNLGTSCDLYIVFIDMSESRVWVKPDVQVQPHHGHYAHRPLAYDTLPSCQRHGHSCQEDAIPKSSIEAFVVCLYIWIHFCQPAGGDFPKVSNYM